ncbi:unnamed protein product [Didymodactylos carnosus]|uniref:Uncharacterized protein n=1 Tax=Didymodactylos carnosus TaxID=1234261 RepID=A0A813UK79_9BILA|nr:unnamed protein product [Didymodactylos carnosus]CAF3617250.1 unnamed protein product [Didymodactylos carnosus]
MHDCINDETTTRELLEQYMENTTYADLTDHFIYYPIFLQARMMTFIEHFKTDKFLNFTLTRTEADQAKLNLFLQDAARYLHDSSTRLLYRSLLFQMKSISSRQSCLKALIVGTVFLPLTTNESFLDEFYHLLSSRYLLTSTMMDTFFHVLWPTGINQIYSVPRAYLSMLVIVRLASMNQVRSREFTQNELYSYLLQICYLIHVRVPNININLMHLFEPICECDKFKNLSVLKCSMNVIILACKNIG